MYWFSRYAGNKKDQVAHVYNIMPISHAYTLEPRSRLHDPVFIKHVINFFRAQISCRPTHAQIRVRN